MKTFTKPLLLLIPLAAVLLFNACRNNDDEGSSGKADLELSFEAIAGKPEIGDEVNFQINLYNRGPMAADGVTVENRLPAGYRLTGAGAGGTDTGEGAVRWQGLSVGADETISLTFAAVAEKLFGDAQFTHLAQVAASNQPDPDSSPGNIEGTPREDDEAALALSPRAAQVTLNFKAFYGGGPLVMFGREYAYEDNMALQMQLFQFYLSDVRLLKGQDGETLTDVALISYGDVYTDEEAAEGKSPAPAVAPPGTYTGIEFGFGLTPELNATIPPDYPLGHPLSENYWDAAGSYIFFKFEANADLEADGNFSEKLTFHVGGNSNYRKLAFDKPITLEDGEERTLQFNIDLRRILVDQNTGAYLDFRQVMQSHSNESPSATFMANHVQDAIEME